MRLILKESFLNFNYKHYLQTLAIPMGTKIAVAVSVIFMAHIEKQPLISYKPT